MYDPGKRYHGGLYVETVPTTTHTLAWSFLLSKIGVMFKCMGFFLFNKLCFSTPLLSSNFLYFSFLIRLFPGLAICPFPQDCRLPVTHEQQSQYSHNLSMFMSGWFPWLCSSPHFCLFASVTLIQFEFCHHNLHQNH